MNINGIITEIKNDKKKLLGTCCLLVIILGIIGMVVSPPNEQTTISEKPVEEDLFNKSVGIKTSAWDYNPDGFTLLGKDVYGTCEGVTSDGKEHTYLFTDKQMAALGNISDYTFEFTDLHIISEDTDKGHMVTHMFYKNGTEIPLNWDVYDFKAYAKVAGANNPNCVEGFGYSTSEVNKFD